MVKLAILAFCLLVVQGGLSYLQGRNYYKTINALKSKGVIGIGNRKGRIAAGSVIIIVSGKDGIILDCEEMKGRTVFSRFHKITENVGLSIYSMKTFQENNKKYKKSALAKAIQSIEQQLSN